MSQPVPARLSPLDEGSWAPALENARSGLGTVLNVHRMMAHHPELLAAWTPLRQHITTGGTLSARHRELIILRVAALSGVAYEWHHHVDRASRVGVGATEIEAVRTSVARDWPDEEVAALLGATDELFQGLAVGDDVWEALNRQFSTPQIFDLVVTVGMYTTLAMFINTTGVQIEAGT
jgi:alkylhydroperoxidase family enzyme